MSNPIAVLCMSNVHKTYHLGAHEVRALQGVSLRVHAGEMLALTGPSGSGKSTILNIAGLIDTADSGDVFLGDRAVSTLDARSATLVRRDAVGFVFQSFNLVPVMTAFENVEFPLFLAGMTARARRQAVNDMLASVGLLEHAAHRPDALSGGQRQRLAIARALIKRPALVIADEPTANLDSGTAEQILDLMREQGHAHRAAFLIATHDDRLLSRCDRRLHLTDGRIDDEHLPAMRRVA